MKLVLAVTLCTLAIACDPAADAEPAHKVVQPKRSAADTARFAAIDDALAAAIAKAKAATTLADACTLADLDKKLYELDKVTPPAGTEPEFTGQLHAVYMRFQDVKSAMCVNGSWTLADVRGGLETLRKVFAGFEGIGAPSAAK